MRALTVRLCLIVALSTALAAEEIGQWGLIANEPGAQQGYTLFIPQKHESIYLLDMQGRFVHKWETGERPANSVYLLEDGRLLRAIHTPGNEVFGAPPFGGGRIQILNWDGEIEWNYRISDSKRYQHHDIEPMPNGNVLAIVGEYRSRDDALAAGRNPDLLEGDKLFPETVLEIKRTGPETGKIVWEWRLWDHLIQDFDSEKANYGVIADHPGLFDINIVSGKGSDWNHANGISYNAELDQIMISMRSQHEIIVIDHSTTTEQARGHSGGKQGKGGDLIYRWGNPQNYGRGGKEDQKVFGQHNPTWIAPGFPGAGDILVFNNGQDRPGGDHSTVEQLRQPVDGKGAYRIESGKPFGPDAPAWSYVGEPKESFYSYFISGAQRLPSGNTFICSGAWSRFFEVTPAGEIVWEYRTAIARPDAPLSAGGERAEGAPAPDEAAMRGVGVFRATRYAMDYPGLRGKVLRPLETQ